MRAHRGFTIIEVIVTIVVLSILAGMAFTSFRAVRNGTEATGRRNALRQVATNVSLWEQHHNAWPSIAVTANMERSVTFVAGTAVPGDWPAVSMWSGPRAGDDQQWLGLATVSPTGACLTIARPPHGSELEEVTAEFTPGPSEPCTGTQALQREGLQW